MKVCLVSQEYPPDTGGISSQVWLKAHALTNRGHEVHVISSTYEEPPRTYMDGKVVVHRISDPSEDTHFSEPSVHWVGYSWAVARRLYQLLDEVEFDIIEFPEYGAEGFIYQLDAYQHHHTPIVVYLYGSLTMWAERTGWPEPDSDLFHFGIFMEETSVRRANLLFAASLNMANFWSQRCAISPEKICVVHSAVDAKLFSPRPERANGRPTVLFVGRVDEGKGLFTLGEAILRLRRKYPSILLRIVGEGSEEDMGLLRQTIATNHAEENFELVGRVLNHELPQHYAACDVFASPAPQEHGLATVYLEAFACEKPVVACNTAGAPEAVLDGETGLLVAPGDANAVAVALDQLLANPEMRQTLGRNGRKRVLEYFAIDKHIIRVEEAYRRLLAHWREGDSG
jgi:glycosyltransferase involved in cell wall biosynthesis